MKVSMKAVLGAIALLVSSKAMASLPSQENVDISWYQPTAEEYARDIGELQARGVIEIVDGNVVLKNESALDQLRLDGRVELVAAAYGSICY